MLRRMRERWLLWRYGFKPCVNICAAQIGSRAACDMWYQPLFQEWHTRASALRDIEQFKQHCRMYPKHTARRRRMKAYYSGHTQSVNLTLSLCEAVELRNACGQHNATHGTSKLYDALNDALRYAPLIADDDDDSTLTPHGGASDA